LAPSSFKRRSEKRLLTWILSRWTVRYLPRKDDYDDPIRVRAMRQHVHYDSIRAFLEHAGTDFENFQITGLKYFNIAAQRLVEINEDEAGDDECDSVPVGVGLVPLQSSDR